LNTNATSSLDNGDTVMKKLSFFRQKEETDNAQISMLYEVGGKRI
jgi:hypothetical protein